MTLFVSDDEYSQPYFLRSSDRTPSYAPTPGYFSRLGSPSEGCPSPESRRAADEHSFALEQADPVSSPHVVEQHDERSIGEQPDRNHYMSLIEWRVTLNHRVIAKDTEQDLVQPPSVRESSIELTVFCDGR